jgi:alpha-L-rhamnosidase
MKPTTFPGWTLALAALLGSACAQTDLSRRFTDPPESAKPHTWWHWMNGNVTSEGITADLEAMHDIGLGGAQIFQVSEGIPPGPVDVMSPKFRELVKHAVAEATRLGLEICMHNCAGWSSSGGPWVTPEHSMQTLVSSETHVRGPNRAPNLPQPETRAGFYRDVAVLAFPTPRDDARRIPDIAVKAGFDVRYGLEPALDAYPPESIVPALSTGTRRKETGRSCASAARRPRSRTIPRPTRAWVSSATSSAAPGSTRAGPG